ncbi:MAG TPA: hypothetical protein VGM88_01675 [Kofleriaceae bacterium]
MMNRLASALFALSLVACVADDPPPPAEYPVADDAGGDADLVEVSPGVEVLADYDEPIFYADDYYWVNRGGIWYSSTWYGGGWARAGHVPGGVIGIREPGRYVHYRPAGYVAHAHVTGGFRGHAEYHAAHVSSGVHVRGAVRGGGGHGGGGHGGGGHRR